jgi:hypothetical protein
MNNRQFIDLFKEVHGLAYDLDLAHLFGLSKGQLSDWVSERRPIPMPLKFRMLQLIDFPHTSEFAPMFVDAAEHAALVRKDREAIADLKATRR